MSKKSKTSIKTIHVEDDFKEIGPRTIDQRKRIVLSVLENLPEVRRVKVYINKQGEILIKPLVEIPASEAWLYNNKKALASVRKGLEQASKGQIKELDLEESD